MNTRSRLLELEVTLVLKNLGAPFLAMDQQVSQLVTNVEVLQRGLRDPLFREPQITQLRSTVTVESGHAWLYGPPGTGKSFCVAHLFRHEAHLRDVLLLSVNCREKPTPLSAIEHLLDIVRPLRSPFRTLDRQLSLLRGALQDRRVVIVLDEIDALRRQSAEALLYHLSNLRRASLICISASSSAMSQISDSVRSRLTPRQIAFPSFDHQQVGTILREVCDEALRPGTLGEATIEHVSACAQGDARRALALLRQAVHRAEESASPVVLPEHVESYEVARQEPRPREPLSSFSSHFRILHDIVCTRGPVARTELGARYRTACVSAGITAVSPRTITNYLDRLAQLGLVAREHGAGTPGWIYTGVMRPSAPHNEAPAASTRRPFRRCE